MPSYLLIEATGHIVMLLVAFAFATAVKALASVLRTWIEQTSRTRRLIKSLEDAKPHQRPEIIMACGQLEGKSVDEPVGDRADDAFLASEHRRPPVLILPVKRGDGPQGD